MLPHYESLLLPAKTAQDLFQHEKVASAISRMPDDEKKWPQHIQSELMRELPFLAQYDIDIVLDRSEPEAGAALGYVQVRNKTMSRPQDNISTPGNILRIPIIVQERRLQKFYIFEAGGQTYPLTEDRVQQAMLNPAVFDTDATRVPASSSLIDKLYPPYQQRQGFGRVTEPAALGLSKLSSAPSAGDHEKVAVRRLACLPSMYRQHGHEWLESFENTPFYKEALAIQEEDARRSAEDARQRASEQGTWVKEAELDASIATLEGDLAKWRYDNHGQSHSTTMRKVASARESGTWADCFRDSPLYGRALGIEKQAADNRVERTKRIQAGLEREREREATNVKAAELDAKLAEWRMENAGVNVKTASAYQRLAFLMKMASLTPEELAMYDAYSGDPSLAARHIPAPTPAAVAAPAAGPKVIVQPGTGEASRRLRVPATSPSVPVQAPTATAAGGGGAGVPPQVPTAPAPHTGGELPLPHGGGEMIHVPASPLARTAPVASEAGHTAGALHGRLGLAALGTGALLGGAALWHHRRQQAAAQQPEKTTVASSPYERLLHTSKVAVSFGAQDNGAGGAEEWKGRLSDMEDQVAAEQQAAADQQVVAAQQQAAGAGGAGAGGGQKKTDGKDVAIDRLTGTLQEEMRHRHGIEKALLESATGINIDTGSTQARAPAQQEQATGAVPAATREAPVQEVGAPATAGAQPTAMPEPTSAYEKLSSIVALGPVRGPWSLRRGMGLLSHIKVAGTVEVPHNHHPITVHPPQEKRREFPFVGFIDFQGLKVDVENRKGDVRRGKDKDGHAWAITMRAHYGEIRDTEGVDGDNLDVYVGPNHDSSLVVVIRQHKPDTGAYDEDKVMLGWDTVEDAVDAYKRQYDRPGFYKEGDYLAMPIGQFWRWVHDTRKHGKKVASGTEKVALSDELLSRARTEGFVNRLNRISVTDDNAVRRTLRQTQLLDDELARRRTARAAPAAPAAPKVDPAVAARSQELAARIPHPEAQAAAKARAAAQPAAVTLTTVPKPTPAPGSIFGRLGGALVGNKGKFLLGVGALAAGGLTLKAYSGKQTTPMQNQAPPKPTVQVASSPWAKQGSAEKVAVKHSPDPNVSVGSALTGLTLGYGPAAWAPVRSSGARPDSTNTRTAWTRERP